MPLTYEPIASTTLSSAASSITLSSIPSGFTDLRLVIALRDATSGYGLLRVNGDSGGNYSRTVLRGDGSAPSSFRSSNITEFYCKGSTAANSFALTTLDFMSYANTSVFKTILAADAGFDSQVERTVYLWRSTAAITSIALLSVTAGATLAAGSTVALYGIRAAV